MLVQPGVPPEGVRGPGQLRGGRGRGAAGAGPEGLQVGHRAGGQGTAEIAAAEEKKEY